MAVAAVVRGGCCCCEVTSFARPGWCMAPWVWWVVSAWVACGVRVCAAGGWELLLWEYMAVGATAGVVAHVVDALE